MASNHDCQCTSHQSNPPESALICRNSRSYCRQSALWVARSLIMAAYLIKLIPSAGNFVKYIFENLSQADNHSCRLRSFALSPLDSANVKSSLPVATNSQRLQKNLKIDIFVSPYFFSYLRWRDQVPLSRICRSGHRRCRASWPFARPLYVCLYWHNGPGWPLSTYYIIYRWCNIINRITEKMDFYRARERKRGRDVLVDTILKVRF